MKRFFTLLVFAALPLLVFGNRVANKSAGVGTGLKTGLTAYYAFDETSGDLVDASGNGYTVTLTGTATRSSGGPLSFYRTLAGIGSANFFSSTNAIFKPGASSFSFSVWVNPTTLTQGSYPGIIALYGTSNHAYLLYFDDPSDRLHWAVSANGTADTDAGSGANLVAGSWSFFVVVCNGTNARISQNGGTFVDVSFSSAIFSAVADFYIGTVNGSSSTWSGSLTGVGYWNGRALSQSDVTLLYNAGAGLPYTSW